ncbi:hypothetical protein NKH89_23785 [Mesorhizobium sp. M0923]|uniref:hypothetical protein n=1 Tax=Mesorhizobium sp. M0923 TaxID=2957028 RepID=UPI003334CA22
MDPALIGTTGLVLADNRGKYRLISHGKDDITHCPIRCRNARLSNPRQNSLLAVDLLKILRDRLKTLRSAIVTSLCTVSIRRSTTASTISRSRRTRGVEAEPARFWTLAHLPGRLLADPTIELCQKWGAANANQICGKPQGPYEGKRSATARMLSSPTRPGSAFIRVEASRTPAAIRSSRALSKPRRTERINRFTSPSAGLWRP